jgi:hypothetical protein
MEVFQMIAFIKNYSLTNIKNKFLLLYILNVTDIIFTLLLLSTGFYMEANALMSNAVQSPVASFALTLVLPAVIFIIVYVRMHKATDQQLKRSNLLINAATALYALINLSHLLWFAILPILAIFQ